MSGYDERRNFRRYKTNTEFHLKIGEERYECTAVDYSVDGISLLFPRSFPEIKVGDIIDISVEDPDIEMKGEMKWKKAGDDGLVIGFYRVNEIKGSCYVFKLPDLLLGIQRLGKTGTLEIVFGYKMVKVFFKDGEMIFAQSNQEDDRFGEVLLKEGEITLEQYFEASKILAETGKRLGTILIELGYMKPNQLVGAVRHQVVEIIFNMITTDCGNFVFHEGALPSDEAITLNLSAANIIYRGIRKMTNFQYILEDFPSLETVLTFSEDPLDLFQDLALDKTSKELIRRIDGKKTIRDILSPSQINDFEAIKMIYALLCARIITVRREDDTGPVVEAEDVFSEPLAEVDPEFEGMIEKMRARVEKGNYYEVLGVDKQAKSDEIKRSYFKLTKEFHPDRHFSIGSDEVRKKLNTISSFINAAYSCLSDPARRSEYDQSISSGVGGVEEGRTASREEMAAEKYEDGRSKMMMGMYEEAEKTFAQAIYFDDSNPNFHYYHGLALNKLGLVKEAARSMEKAVQLKPDGVRFMIELGYVFLKMGMKKRAETNFKRALDIDPQNEKAIKGLSKALE
ncbi:MAG: DnaJ domain-containing protein [Nitrospirota bacterium]|nr:MAG: DnaJ domain-containing protein [Nitrospirota bacterium]